MDVYFAGGWWRVDGPTLACVAHQVVEFAEQRQRAGKQVAWATDVPAPRACNIRASALVLDERTDGSLHVLSIFNLGAGRLRVDRTENVDALFALRTTLRCAREPTRLNRERLRHVGVKRFKTGKRVGQFRFTRAHDEAYRARVRADDAFNRALVERRAYAIDAVDDAVQVLLSECVRWDVETVVEAEACEEACTVLAEALSWDRAEVRIFLQEKAERFAVERMRRASIEDYGFGPGERVTVLNPGGHKDQPEGPGEVLAAWAYSEGGEIVHVRQVHCAGRTWDVPVSVLRKPG